MIAFQIEVDRNEIVGYSHDGLSTPYPLYSAGVIISDGAEIFESHIAIGPSLDLCDIRSAFQDSISNVIGDMMGNVSARRLPIHDTLEESLLSFLDYKLRTGSIPTVPAV